MLHKSTRCAAVAVAILATAGCTVHNTEAPSVGGPSTFAMSFTMNAIPDSISQDGGSQAAIKVTMIGPDGKPLSAVPLRVDMNVNGVPQDFGTLSARTIVTDSNGVASLVYTAPPSPSNGVFGTCGSLPGTCVSIVATPTGTNFQTAVSQSVQIRLVPPGIILPPAGTPAPCFTISPGTPTTATANIAEQFTAGTLVSGVCQAATSDITTFAWSFGDGSSASGRVVSHVFAVANTFNVTLTETNDRGVSASTTVTVAVGVGVLPSAQFTFSPAAPGVNETVFFNASTSTPGPGHSIVSYRWTFGDGATGSGVTVSHAYATAGTYTVQLTVTDEAGQSVTSTGTQITPGNPPGPRADFTFSPNPPQVGDVVVFDYRTSTTSQGQRIVSLDWNFGDGTPIVHCPGDGACTSDGITTHVFRATGNFFVNLVVTDSAGRTSVASRAVAVGNGNPTVSFTASPNAPRIGEEVTFDAGGTLVFGAATIQSYSWTFGDPASPFNTSTDGPTTKHIFVPGAVGPRTITLTVVDSFGRRGSASLTITVNNP
jgi:PKD repeat protein